MIITMSMIAGAAAAGAVYAVETVIQHGITAIVSKRRAEKAAEAVEESPAEAGDDPSNYFEGSFPQPAMQPAPPFPQTAAVQDQQARDIASAISAVQEDLLNAEADDPDETAPADQTPTDSDPASELAATAAAITKKIEEKIEDLFASAEAKIQAEITSMKAEIEELEKSEVDTAPELKLGDSVTVSTNRTVEGKQFGNGKADTVYTVVGIYYDEDVVEVENKKGKKFPVRIDQVKRVG